MKILLEIEKRRHFQKPKWLKMADLKVSKIMCPKPKVGQYISPWQKSKKNLGMQFVHIQLNFNIWYRCTGNYRGLTPHEVFENHPV
jgi:hypothetical protein